MTEKRDFKDTVFLPKTDFPMKAGLPQKEPGILARWQEIGLYEKLRDARRGREKFVLHDGPPYANGDMHIGHALNHVLKDMVVRTQSLTGKDAPYVPGWDCHGLPIEWKVEEQYRKKKKNKDEVPAKEFRAECRAYAQHWVDTQREQLKRLGINGDWENPYLTMQFESEATIVAELLKFAESGQLYRGAKPVMWSPVEKTALAEAEVEYEDITSTQIDVAFEIVESPIPELVGAHAVIWTTTPWTIPVNQALAYGPDVDYVLVKLTDESPKFLVAFNLVDEFVDRLARSIDPVNKDKVAAKLGGWVAEGVKDKNGLVSLWGYAPDATFKGSELAGTVARHPMHHLGGFYAAPRPLLPGDFVTTDSGTGLVHMAPDHGEDDFDLCKAHGIEPKFVVDGDGRYREDWLWLPRTDERSMSVINPKFNAPDGPVCSDLREVGALLSASTDYQHSYPHSWRSKAKVIFRCTPQWFVPMDLPNAVEHIDNRAEARWENEGGAQEPKLTLRQAAMQAIADTRFVPAKGRNRIGSMVEGRPDWVLSRQRAWGVPITLFVDRKSGQYLNDPAVNARIVESIRTHGVDGWDEDYAAAILGPDYDLDDYERITDILDVWFDSGSTHAFVLESGRWPDLQWPADLYLEGSDQHRGWFQSSLLESCGTRGRAPYKAVLTHGFTMASDGKKMSKSLGNTVDPNKVMEEYGADIIRLWALSVDYTEDHRIGPEILKGVGDQYRRLRNTFRYLLGALQGFSDAERVDAANMPELERYVLSLLGDVDATLRTAIDDFDFNTYVRTLVDFCNEDLSAFFFDIRKDSLYCDAPGDLGRRAYRTVLDTLFHALIRWAAPVLVFTAEEVWQSRFPGSDSVHLLEWPEVPAANADKARWSALRDLRERVNEAIEPLRREKTVRSSLQAEVEVPAAAVPEGFSDADLEELFITATVTRGQGDAVIVKPTDLAKCGRCWRHLPEVREDGDACDRCDSVVEGMEAA
ncbi:isoleucine--tRNA ligase [Croceicoccus naphthovorans]|uniref:Isoleucine--tRNA ligase n=1 Tax=Croceicoccus naphthovorans TaxID=1348774 RepID=A0A0G3XE68_9SPHN|nr:isoleucine--tRNA ligase [Croceicoccus naphthovorans]AKM08936.1 isoleucine--tRNA ligase [Croceicoccus naphthovorans]MBB3989277.1 isoleucyl-tRNA synthetase [Croceicoccus naphthovorans]